MFTQNSNLHSGKEHDPDLITKHSLAWKHGDKCLIKEEVEKRGALSLYEDAESMDIIELDKLAAYMGKPSIYKTQESHSYPFLWLL